MAKPIQPARSVRGRTVKGFWRRVRLPLARSRLVRRGLAAAIAAGLRFVRATNPLAPGAETWRFDAHEPLIIALWHGQHFLTPTFYPRTKPLVAMVSRSADAELNAAVLERFGIGIVRGSGGRDGLRHGRKGGASALIALKRTLDAGTNVCMIADIPNGTPREAGMGIVTLARMSGRPILPAAMTTSRRKILERSWDKAALNLPFGRSAAVTGSLVVVPADADDAMMEAKRRELTAALNRATAEAQRLADGRRTGA